MDSTQAFHAIINLFLIPLWLLSGSLFPLSGASLWIRLLMRINPLTYGTEALRSLLFPARLRPTCRSSANFAVLALFTLVMFALSFLVANRRTTKARSLMQMNPTFFPGAECLPQRHQRGA